MQHTFNSLVTRLLFLGVLAASGLLPLFTSAAFGSNCTLLTGPVPEGYGAAYNVFSEANELIVRASCGERSFRPLVGSILTNSRNIAVYTTGYVYNGSDWEEFRLRPADGVERSGSWILGDASGDQIAYSGETTFFITYACLWASGSWRCGCTDDQCSNTSWQLQAVAPNETSDPEPPDPESIVGFGE